MKALSGLRKRIRGGVIIGVPLLIAAGVWVLLRSDPLTGPGLIPCIFHELTGLYCTGCGITRALASLIHGHVLDALSYNVWAIIWLIYPVWLLLSAWLEAVFGRPVLKKPQGTRVWLMLLLVSALLFLVIRNLPWPPFNVLAP